MHMKKGEILIENVIGIILVVLIIGIIVFIFATKVLP